MNDQIPLKIYFHTGESYYPSSFDFFLSNSILFDKNGQKIGQKTQQELFNVSCPNDREDFVLIEQKDELKYGMKNNIKDIPIYRFDRDYNGKKYITYSLFYPYNGEYNILWLTDAGQHWGDIEHITFEMDNEEVKRVYFGAHGDTDGRWVDVKDVEKRDGQFVAYVAYHGHGFYPKAGNYFRNYGTSNDYTNQGLHISTTVNPVVFIPPKESLTSEDIQKIGLAYFCGKIGSDGINSFVGKTWFRSIDVEKNPPPLINDTKFIIGRSMVLSILFIILLYLFLLGRKIKCSSYAPYVYYCIFILVLILGIMKLKRLIRTFD